MKNKVKDQVELFDFIYTMNWEDPESDRHALKIKPGDKIISITSGGCNTIGYLLYDPSEINAVDINPCQAWVMELKLAAIRSLNHDEFLQFIGIRDCERRIEIYDSLRPFLTGNALAFWDKRTGIISQGFIGKGKYSRYVTLVSKFVKILYGPKKIDYLLAAKDPDNQVEAFKKIMEKRKTRLIFKIFFNRASLARKGLEADYFSFDDGSESFADSFYNKFRHVMCNIPVETNYFLHLYLNGRFIFEKHLPPYMLPENYEIIKLRAGRIKIHTADLKKWLSAAAEKSIDCFGLSNICELMSPADTEKLFTEVLRTAKSGARCSLRNLMIKRDVPEILKDRIRIDNELSTYLKNTDRSFVYSKVAAYNIVK